ncbi:hypothetical protein KP509_35G021800 [Ceratopteris richardii]|uniref:Uncharacterized protein n=1 Tax=Ceratopteris richardii TaxID=49495 RepID=A0A8T2QEX8_CERRI|nr:hypothetical protein KP509_35G021800 [Ceratopteris richardii]KAH7282256.1 hypothetical protein KP509_35G021800 [Ceratopteris richardii]
MTVHAIMPSPDQQSMQHSATLSLTQPISGEPISPEYIHTIQHLIEKCLLFNMDREECAAALEQHAKVKAAVTRTVWNELEKVNAEFFKAYNLQKRLRTKARYNGPFEEAFEDVASSSSSCTSSSIITDNEYRTYDR